MMKKEIITLVSVVVLGLNITFAQEIPQNQVPQPVLQSFAQKFTKASDIEWEKENDYYKVEFELNGTQEYEAWYSADGQLFKYKKEIADKEVPLAIKNMLKMQYPGYIIDDTDKWVQGNDITYKIEIEKDDDKRDLWLDELGKILKKNH